MRLFLLCGLLYLSFIAMVLVLSCTPRSYEVGDHDVLIIHPGLLSDEMILRSYNGAVLHLNCQRGRCHEVQPGRS